MATPARFASFGDFYPYYLREHQNRTNRRLHFAGTSVSLVLAAVIVVTGALRWLPVLLLTTYGFAWVGHFVFERNQPATFRHPFYSLAGDLRMYLDTWRARIPF